MLFLARMLLHENANVNSVDEVFQKDLIFLNETFSSSFYFQNGWTPLMRSVVYGDENLVNLILDARPDPTIRDRWGQSALDMIINLSSDDPSPRNTLIEGLVDEYEQKINSGSSFYYIYIG